jgi:hypothetical protein
MEKTLPYVEFDVILQAIVSYDVYPAFGTSLRETFRSRHDQDISVGEFASFISYTVDSFSREAVFGRLIGQLAYRNIATYDDVEKMLRHQYVF